VLGAESFGDARVSSFAFCCEPAVAPLADVFCGRLLLAMLAADIAVACTCDGPGDGQAAAGSAAACFSAPGGTHSSSQYVWISASE